MPKPAHLAAALAALPMLTGCVRHAEDAAHALAAPARGVPRTGVIAAIRPAAADSPACAAILRALSPAPAGGAAPQAAPGELIVRLPGGEARSLMRGTGADPRVGERVLVEDATAS